MGSIGNTFIPLRVKCEGLAADGDSTPSGEEFKEPKAKPTREKWIEIGKGDGISEKRKRQIIHHVIHPNAIKSHAKYGYIKLRAR